MSTNVERRLRLVIQTETNEVAISTNENIYVLQTHPCSFVSATQISVQRQFIDCHAFMT
jgi:hypothetical protein